MLRLSTRSDVRVRPARPRDAVRLGQLHVASWHAAYRDILEPATLSLTTARRSVTRFCQQFSHQPVDHGVSVLEHLLTGQLWGYVTVGPQRNSRYPYRGEIYELYVHPARQGLGAGRRLLAAGMWDLVGKGQNPVMLWVLEDNPRARRFYERCGAVLFATGDARVGQQVLATAGYGWPSTLPCPMD